MPASAATSSQLEALARQLDAKRRRAVWDRGEWALLRGKHFAWLLTRRIPDRPRPFVDPVPHDQARTWLDSLDDTARTPTTIDRDWYSATLAAEARIAALVQQLSDGRSAL